MGIGYWALGRLGIGYWGLGVTRSIEQRAESLEKRGPQLSEVAERRETVGVKGSGFLF